MSRLKAKLVFMFRSVMLKLHFVVFGENFWSEELKIFTDRFFFFYALTN